MLVLKHLNDAQLAFLSILRIHDGVQDGRHFMSLVLYVAQWYMYSTDITLFFK